jgi:rRNA-processing protein FCF1
MKKIILDTNFILTCVKQRIDFFEELKNWGAKIIIPEEVIGEIKRIVNSRKKAHVRRNASLSLLLLERNREFFEQINLENKNVDEGLIELGKNEENIIATLDREIKKGTKRNLIIKRKKMLEIV